MRPTRDPRTLREKRVLFSFLLARLILFAFRKGYEVAVDQVKRTKAEAAANAAKGSGIRNSLHCDGLAADLVLYRDGKWLPKTEDYALLGNYWRGLHSLCAWGGSFSRPDGGHFSVKHGGRM